MVVSIDVAGLDAGEYSYDLEVSCAEAINSPQFVTVSLEVVGPALEISQTNFEFSALEDGSNPGPQILSITNTAGGFLDWTVTFNEPCEWLSAEPASGSAAAGETNEVELSIDISGLNAGPKAGVRENPLSRNRWKRIANGAVLRCAMFGDRVRLE